MLAGSKKLKLLEIEIDSPNSKESEIDDAVYAIVDMITELEEDGEHFKITIEKIGPESTAENNKYLH